MNNKSRNIHAACAASTAANLSNNKFMKDYYKTVQPYLHDDISGKIASAPTINELRLQAEQEFINSYGLFPTCAVYAPGCLTVAGKSTDLAESKSLSMAVQLVTLIVGKRSHGSKWCQVKTFSGRGDGETFELRLSNETLRVTPNETRLMRYLKGTLRSFKSRRAHVPGFQIVITSTLPVRRGLGSSSSLVVALFTFLEAMTNTYSGNAMEKTLACILAKKIATGTYKVRVTDIATSVLGSEGKIYAVDARTLDVIECPWIGVDVELIFIELGEAEKRLLYLDDMRYKEIMTVMNTVPRWRTHPDGIRMLDLLFARETMDMVRAVIDKDGKVVKMTAAIEEEKWDEVGKLMWENNRTACKYLKSLSDDTEHLLDVLETTEGVLGATVISFGASIVALVQKAKLKSFVLLLNRMNISQKQYYVTKASTGATTIYTYERRMHSWKYHALPKAKVIYNSRDKEVVEEKSSKHEKIELLT